MANLAHAAERQTISVMLDGLLKHLNNTDDKAKTYLKMVDMAQARVFSFNYCAVMPLRVSLWSQMLIFLQNVV